MPDPTTNYKWNKPDVGGDRGRWGGLLNAIIDSIDTVLKSVEDLATAALAKAGGTLTGLIEVHSDVYTPQDLGGVLSGAVNINVTKGRFFYGVVDSGANVSFSLTNPPADKALFIIVELSNGGGAASVAWGNNIIWSDGDAPVLSNGTDVFSFYTRNGTNWRAQQIHRGT